MERCDQNEWLSNKRQETAILGGTVYEKGDGRNQE